MLTAGSPVFRSIGCAVLCALLAGCAGLGYTPDPTAFLPAVPATPPSGMAQDAPVLTDEPEKTPETTGLTGPVQDTQAQEEARKWVASRLDLWWKQLNSPELERLLDRAILTSPRLQMAAQKVVQERARMLQGHAALLPELTARFGYSVEAPKGGTGSVLPGQRPKASEAYEAVLKGTWSPDFFGERQSFAEAAELRFSRELYRYEDQMIRLMADLTKAYIEYLSLNDRIQNAVETEQALIRMLRTMHAMYEKGDATIIDMHMQRSSVYGSRVTFPTLELERERVRNKIALLSGIPSEELNLSDRGMESITLPMMPDEVASSHVLRRPDVRALELGMWVAQADLAVARAKVLPSFQLGATFGYGASRLSTLFQPHTLIWDFIAQVSAAVFDGGHRRSEVDLANAMRSELVEAYVYSIYSGLVDINNALHATALVAERLNIQIESRDAARIAQEYSVKAYQLEGMDPLTLLDTTHTYQKRVDDYFVFRKEYHHAFIDLYSALGGGLPVVEDWPASFLAVRVAHESGRRTQAEPEGRPDFDPWQVRLSGVHDRFGVLSAHRALQWLDENEEAPILFGVEPLFLEKADRVPDGKGDWYRLSLNDLATEAQARRLCERLSAHHIRCEVHEGPLSPTLSLFQFRPTHAVSAPLTAPLAASEPDKTPLVIAQDEAPSLSPPTENAPAQDAPTAVFAAPLPELALEPAAPKPAAPEPAVLKPVAPEPVAPEPVAPEPVAPEPVAPEPAAPEPAAPEPAAPEPVAPEPAVPEPATPNPVAEPSPAPGIYFVQIGSFRSPVDAQRQQTALAALGVPAYIEARSRQFRVRVGPYGLLDEALDQLHFLTQQGVSAVLIEGE